MSPRKKRLGLLLGALVILGLAVALVLRAFQSNLVFFYTPSQILSGEAFARVSSAKVLRLGGMVEAGSVVREGVQVRFRVSDGRHAVPVRYQGILPDLFKEGKGVVTQGRMGPDGVFEARDVLAKHDENYMPGPAHGQAGHPDAHARGAP